MAAPPAGLFRRGNCRMRDSKDTWPFCFRTFSSAMETVVPEKHAAGIAIHVPAAL